MKETKLTERQNAVFISPAAGSLYPAAFVYPDSFMRLILYLGVNVFSYVKKWAAETTPHLMNNSIGFHYINQSIHR